eukprot:GHVS01089412.1.p1 GENE.GHVS01089412.1~~GHVS01089412.1.p1  ORF type:complete len:675 (+),score=66.49 GHVS01089412.1:99-2123(+)
MGPQKSSSDIGRQRLYSVPVPNSAKPGFSCIYRTPETANGELVRSLPETKFSSFFSGLVGCSSRHPDDPAVGSRKRNADGSRGEYEWISFKQLRSRVISVGSSLLNLNIAAEQTFDIPGDAKYPRTYRFLGINSKNREEWTILDLACNAFGITSVPLYDTLGDEATEFIMNETKLQTVCADRSCVDHLLKNCSRLTVKKIICFDEITSEEKELASAGSVELIDYASLLHPSQEQVPVEQKEEFVTTICYTSGTTGNPKGVVLTNAGFLATHAGALQRDDMFKAGRGDVHMSYLPMAHVYERMAQFYFLLQGAAIGFYSGDTLKLMDDLQVLRPTIFLSVPRLYMRIVDKVESSVGDKGRISQWLFNAGMRSKLHYYRTANTTTHALYDKVVFAKVQKLLGGRLRVLTTGSAPLEKGLQEKLSCLFSCNMLEGWGMTETYALACCQGTGDCVKGTVGGFVGSLEFRLQSIPEMQYDAENKEKPRGELMVRGPSVFNGYFMNPEETTKTLDAEGWFRTGDVVEVRDRGAVKVIDRKKNIYKLAQGEYVAPEKIEGVYGQAHLIAQIFAHGKFEKACMVAVVVPDDEAVQRWAIKNGKPTKPLSEHVKDSDLNREIMREMKDVSKGKLKGFEEVKGIYLTPELFSIDNLLLTATFKIIRHKAKQVFEKEIDELYASL